MSERLFGAFDIVLAFACALGIGLWELAGVRGRIRLDRDAMTGRKPDLGGPRQLSQAARRARADVANSVRSL